MRNMYCILNENETPKINDAKMSDIRRAAALSHGIIIQKNNGDTITYTSDEADLNEAAIVIKEWKDEAAHNHSGLCMHAMMFD